MRRKLELIWSATTFKLRSVFLICMIMSFCHLTGHGNNIQCKCAVHHIFSRKTNFNEYFNQLERMLFHYLLLPFLYSIVSFTILYFFVTRKQGRRKVWKYGGACSNVSGRHNVPPLVETGFIDLIKQWNFRIRFSWKYVVSNSKNIFFSFLTN